MLISKRKFIIQNVTHMTQRQLKGESTHQYQIKFGNHGIKLSRIILKDIQAFQ